MIETENPETEGVLDCIISRVNHLEAKDVSLFEIDSLKGSCISEKHEDGLTFLVKSVDDLCRDGCANGVIANGSEELKNIGCSFEGEVKQVSLPGACNTDDLCRNCYANGVIVGGSEDLKNIGCSYSFEEEVKQVNLYGACNTTTADVNDEEAESASSSSSSSTTDEADSETDDGDSEIDDDDDDDKEEEVNVGEDVEEGEILELDVDEVGAWDACEEDIDDDDDDNFKRPIRSKNELEVLPFVPQVTITLQPYHEALPVGLILSMMGPQVIVEGVEKHNPLSEGSILWITESRTPLGIVDEIFGPVKNPYYKVRYNSEEEVPSEIHEGTLVSFVSEFATHVLNDKDVYKKGYDASNENDEELSEDIEFSDDEKEAAYKKALKDAKRHTGEGIARKRNSVKNKNKRWKAVVTSSASNSTVSVHGNSSNSGIIGQTPCFRVSEVGTGFSNGISTNGCLPHQQNLTAGMIRNESPAYSMVLPPTGMPFIQNAMPFQNNFPNAFSQPNFVPSFHGSSSQFPSNPNPNPASINGSSYQRPSNVSFPQFSYNSNPNPFQQPCPNVSLPPFLSIPNPNPNSTVGMNFHGQNPYQQNQSPNMPLPQFFPFNPNSNPNPNPNSLVGMNFHGQNPYQHNPSPNVLLPQFPSNPNPNPYSTVGMNFHGQNQSNPALEMNFQGQNPYQMSGNSQGMISNKQQMDGYPTSLNH